jgi:sulfur-carrier protein adenylyltransferase/sulfurtransferase
MQRAIDSSVATNMTSSELRDFLRTHHEGEFALIDVREPDEYMEGHIPGARLMPLSELESRVDELKQLEGRRLVFYCRSGGRSGRASAWAAQVLRLPFVYNLSGGFMAWDGQTLIDFPRLGSFALDVPLENQLRRALDFEKGSHRLYQQLASEYKSGLLAHTIAQLVDAELAHGEVVHRLLMQATTGNRQSFAEEFAQATGAIVENGIGFDALIATARNYGDHGEMALLEFALEIELGAYDLYKNLATSATTEQARAALSDLAQQEKGHADLVLSTIGRMAKGKGSSGSP